MRSAVTARGDLTHNGRGTPPGALCREGFSGRLGVAGGARRSTWWSADVHGLHTVPLASIGWPTGIQVVSDIADLLAHDGGHYGAIEASLAGMRDEPATPRVEINARLPAPIFAFLDPETLAVVAEARRTQPWSVHGRDGQDQPREQIGGRWLAAVLPFVVPVHHDGPAPLGGEANLMHDIAFPARKTDGARRVDKELATVLEQMTSSGEPITVRAVVRRMSSLSQPSSITRDAWRMSWIAAAEQKRIRMLAEGSATASRGAHDARPCERNRSRYSILALVRVHRSRRQRWVCRSRASGEPAYAKPADADT